MKSLLAGAAAVLLLAACNSDALPPASGFTTVSGTIVDSTSNQPIAGAVVTIDTVLSATTDASGKFTIEKVPSGAADFTVQAKGYKIVSSSVNLEPAKPYELDLTLAIGKP